MSEAYRDPLAKIKHKLELEIRAIESELVNDLPKEIAKARAHGDLSENSEYKYAKERQTYLNATRPAEKAHGRHHDAEREQSFARDARATVRACG